MDEISRAQGITHQMTQQLEQPYTRPNKTENVALTNFAFYLVSNLSHASVMNPVDAFVPLSIPIKLIFLIILLRKC